jgi:NAD+ synthase (glutamine-hydrolysing)
MSHSVHISLIQHSFLVGDIKANTNKIITLSEQSRQSGADLVVFPELAVTGYPPEDLLLRRSFIEQTDAAVQQIIQSVSGIDLVFGAPRHEGKQLYNAAFWVRDGELRGVYNKYTLPNYAVFDEKRYFTAGHQPLVVDVKGIKFAVTICEDIWCRSNAGA